MLLGAARLGGHGTVAELQSRTSLPGEAAEELLLL